MLHGVWLGRDFFALLVKIDCELVDRVAEAGCPRCDGPLHRGDYDRKPRGGLVAGAGEAFCRRFSLCCGSCRRRCLPPSMRFLGRRVYFEAVVFLASVWALCGGGDIAAAGVPVRTVRRWLGWWTSVFPGLPTWVELRARLPPPAPAELLLPLSLLEHLSASLGPFDAEQLLIKAARLLAPVTTQSCPKSSRFVWAD